LLAKTAMMLASILTNLLLPPMIVVALLSGALA